VEPQRRRSAASGEHVRHHRDDGARDLSADGAGRYGARSQSDWRGHSRSCRLSARCRTRTGADRRGGRALCRGCWARARLSRPSGPDRRAFSAAPIAR
jgi:hypothetical protein